MSELGLTILGICLIFLATSLGSGIVFFFKKELNGKLNTLFLGFASGVMIAASIWSLLVPSIEQASNYGSYSFIPAAIGFLIGGLFLVLIDKLVPHFHRANNKEEGIKTHLKKPIKMFLAVTIHNIPEGLAVSLPMVNETKSKWKAFLYGIGSGIVEPIFAIVGYFLASNLSSIQPWFLSFAAGAMIFVVVEDLIPETHLSSYPHYGTWGLMLGFVIMMILDVALG